MRNALSARKKMDQIGHLTVTLGLGILLLDCLMFSGIWTLFFFLIVGFFILLLFFVCACVKLAHLAVQIDIWSLPQSTHSNLPALRFQSKSLLWSSILSNSIHKSEAMFSKNYIYHIMSRDNI